MAPYESGSNTSQGSAETDERRPARRRASRYIVPVAVAGVAAATIGLVPALADSGDPELPKISAQELIEKIAASDTEQLSGTVKISTDLGLPSLGGASIAPGAGGEGGATASPDAKLMELASGTHTLRVAADGPERQKLSILEDAAEYSIVHNGDDVWAYDSAKNEAVHAEGSGTADGSGKPEKTPEKAPEGMPSTPKEMAQQALKAVDGTTSVTVDGTAQVAGRDAYQLVIKPKQSGSTVDSVRVAVDAENGTPLKFTLNPSGGGKAVVDAGFTQVDFAKPAASTFDFSPPKGAKVTEADELKGEAGRTTEGAAPEGLDGLGGMGDVKGMDDVKIIGKGWSSVAELKMPGGKGLPSAESGDVPAEAQQFMDALGDKVSGKFGSGTVFETRLINALVTDDGKVYVGAVTQEALVKAANGAK